MTNPEYDTPYESSNEPQFIQPTYRADTIGQLLVKKLQYKIEDVIAKSDELDLLGARVFHNHVNDGDEVSLASEVIGRTEELPGYLRLVINRSSTTILGTEGLIFSSDHIIGLSRITKSINSASGIVLLDDEGETVSNDENPAFIWKGTDSEYHIFAGDYAPFIPLPYAFNLTNETEITIKERIFQTENVRSALEMFSSSTEDARYPLE